MLKELLSAVAAFGITAFAVAWLVVHLIRWRILSRTDELPSLAGEVSDRVSIVLPVRNEEKTVAKTVANLLALRDVVKEVVVVDDNSTDSTFEVLNRFVSDGVKLVKAGPTPHGWMGKCWACHVGYMHASGEYLLFTDADTELSGELLAHALNVAKQRKLDFLTLYPSFRMNSFLHRVAMPILLIGFYIFGKPHLVNVGKSAFAFGSFMLFRREAYEKIGGHYAVRDALLEDRALALRALSHGLRCGLYKALDRLTASWTESSRSLWNGMLRIFTPLSIKHSHRSVLVFVALTGICLFIPLITILAQNYVMLAITYLLAAAVVGKESMRHRSTYLNGLLWPFGVTVIMVAALTAFWKARFNPTIRWRNRTYLVTRGELHEKVLVIS